MRYANHIELQRDMQQMTREARDLAAKARKLEAENKRLRKALEPMTKGTFFLSVADVRRAYKALGKEWPLSVKLAEHRA
jgi:nicotinate-nucleotide pyrophosphorylase